MHAFALLLLLLAAPAGAATIDFDAEAPGFRDNGWTLAGVTFWHSDDTSEHEQLQVLGGALVAGEDGDWGGLRLAFATPITSLAFDFGGDYYDPEISDTPEPGDVALLQAFSSGVLVGQATVVLNLDVLVDQEMMLSGVGAFDTAYFVMRSAGGGGVGADERVDNLTFATVPEAGTLGLGLAALALLARRRVA